MDMGLVSETNFSTSHHLSTSLLPRPSLQLSLKIAREDIDIQPQAFPGDATFCDERNGGTHAFTLQSSSIPKHTGLSRSRSATRTSNHNVKARTAVVLGKHNKTDVAKNYAKRRQDEKKNSLTNEVFYFILLLRR